MSEVKRYDVFAYLEDGGEPELDRCVSQSGTYVMASDYDALAAECERLRAAADQYDDALFRIDAHWKAELAALKGGQEAVAMIRYARGVPVFENEMPHVVSCNDLPDGLYPVYLAPPAQASAWVPVSERLPAETYAYGCHTDDVLCRTRSGKLIIAMLAQTTTGPVWYDQQSQERDVTHWQPLPAAPTPGASDGKEGG